MAIIMNATILQVHVSSNQYLFLPFPLIQNLCCNRKDTYILQSSKLINSEEDPPSCKKISVPLINMKGFMINVPLAKQIINNSCSID